MKISTHSLALFTALSICASTWAADVNPQSVSDLLNRVGGAGTADRFVTVLDQKEGPETFTISAEGNKPKITGSSLSALTTGIGWYLNHYANVNLTWNKSTTDLSGIELPTPQTDETHSTNVVYRYNFNYCTHSYSMCTWTWERWQEEIDWMALRGINMPLQIVGLEEVYRKFLMENYGYTLDEVSKFVAGPAFMAWFGMNNLEGHGGPNPEWWYTRQAQLGRKINDRMRSLGIEPVLPGFYMVPTNFAQKAGVKTAPTGIWCGFTRSHLLDPTEPKYDDIAAKYYSALHSVMGGKSKYYSMDPFHEGGGANAVDVDKVYAKTYAAMNTASAGAIYVIQQWQWEWFQRKSLDNIPVGQLAVLDLFADGKPTWDQYGNHDVIFSTIFNFGGRTGFFGRFNKVISEYAKARQKTTVKGIGAAPEAIEQTPVMYDLLFELPWYSTLPDPAEWMANYARRRYSVSSPQQTALVQEAWELLRNSALNCQDAGQGPHEAVMCGRPALEINAVSSWGFSNIFYDTNASARAAYLLLQANLNGDNYSYDLTDLARQALTDYSKALLAGIKDANQSADGATFTKRRDAFLQLILELDELLNTNVNFMVGNWTERARAMADEVPGTTPADKDWLEHDNARTLITTWANKNSSLRDYSYRQWGGILKDLYYKRWKQWFDKDMKGMTADSFFAIENDWAKNDKTSYPTTPIGNTHEVAARLLPKYLSPLTNNNGDVRYIQRFLETNLAGKFYDQTRPAQTYLPNLNAAGTGIESIAIDLNNNSRFDNNEISTSPEGFPIPAEIALGERRIRIILNDGTSLTYTLQIADEIVADRTVAVQLANAAQGSVSIQGTDAKSVTNREKVTILATGTAKYDFSHWLDTQGNEIRQNPYTYYGKDPQTFTANFVLNKWGVPTWTGSAQDRADMAAYQQYLTRLSVTQGNESKVIYEASALPEEHFFSIPTKIKAAPGGEFTFKYEGNKNGLQYLFLSAYCDIDGDGEFNMDTELLGTIGTRNSANANVASGTFSMRLPYDSKQVVTHIRLRFDSAWGANYDAAHKAFPAKASTNRLVYDIFLEIGNGVDYATTVTVKSNNENFGTVRSENQTNTYNPGDDVILTAFPKPGYRLKEWRDKYDRVLPARFMTDNTARFTAFDNQEFTAIFEPTPLQVNGWDFKWHINSEGKAALTGINTEGNSSLNLTSPNSAELEIGYIKPALFAGTRLANLTLPNCTLQSDVATICSNVMTGVSSGITQVSNTEIGQTISSANPWRMRITGNLEGTSYNQWGSAVLANGTNALAEDYSNGWFQFYIKANGNLVVKWDGWNENLFSNINLNAGPYTILAEYGGNNSNKSVLITATDSQGRTAQKRLSNSANMQDISAFCGALPAGKQQTVTFLSQPETVTPGQVVAGAKALLNIHGGNATEHDGVLYNGSAIIAYPEGRLHNLPFSLGQNIGANPLLEAGALSDLTISDNHTQLASLWQLMENPNGSAIRHLNSGYHANSAFDAVVDASILHSYSLKYTSTGMPALVSGANEHTITPFAAIEVSQPGGQSITFPFAVIIPAQSYVFNLVGFTPSKKGILEQLEEGTLIPAGQPLLIYNSANSHTTFQIAPATATPLAENNSLLLGTQVTLVAPQDVAVVRGLDFVAAPKGSIIPANSAYILQSTVPGGPITTTAKVGFPGALTEGSMIELDSTTPNQIFDLQGRRIIRPNSGLYIRSGRLIRL